jgi:protoporphyrinogen oxidase
LNLKRKLRIVIIGAGPAGLTCAHFLTKRGHDVKIFEQDKSQVGGISKTINHKGFLFDIGGHRFFTKSQEVWNFWKEILPNEEDFLVRKRVSRIYFKNKYFNYPLDLNSIIKNFSFQELVSISISYLTRTRHTKKTENKSLEGFLISKFGPKLYEIFFKSYSEKIWGRKCDQISADWASQRIKGLSLVSAMTTALTPKILRNTKIKTLIDQFHYPRLGPGMMWEHCEKIIKDNGGEIFFGEKIQGMEKVSNHWNIKTSNTNFEADIVISTIPLNSLLEILPRKNDNVTKITERLKFRSYLMVAFILDKEFIFEDNWLYIQDPSLITCRIQNFKNWSQEMVPDQKYTSLGLEYFSDVNSELWALSDDQLKEMAQAELLKLSFATKEEIIDWKVVRVPNAYPVYHLTYQKDLDVLKDELKNWKNLHTIGRGGMFRYNNQDHSIMSAIITCENIVGESDRNPWSVNQDAEYLEEEK